MESWRWRLAVAGLVIACPASVTALAAGRYAVSVRASSPVATGHPFSVTAKGVAAQRALLYVYLGRTACLAKWNTTGRVGVHKLGHSYFLAPQGLGKEPFSYAWVSGSFRKSFTGHAGTAPGREYDCAYLEIPNRYGGYRVTAAHASGSYTVKK